MGDTKSGTIVICHEEHYLSKKKEVNRDLFVDKKNKEKYVNKFIVSLIPRIALVPSVFKDTGPVLSYTLVRSPAPNILV
jgi:hypothetical protein